MKRGKRPTRQQKLILKKHGKDPDQWLVIKNLPEKLEIVHLENSCLVELVDK